MSPAEFEAFSLSLPAATLTVQWGGSRVYKVGGKMFAVAGPAAAGGWSFKASDAAFEMLAAEGVGRPAPYLARAKWIRFEALDVLHGSMPRASRWEPLSPSTCWCICTGPSVGR